MRAKIKETETRKILGVSTLSMATRAKSSENYVNLTYFIKPKNQKISLKTAYKKMRSIGLSGTVSNFDLKLSQILDCSLKDAEAVRQ